MSSDPAVTAAQRAMNVPQDGVTVLNDPISAFAVKAAREALEPLRGLHFQSTRIPSRDYRKCVTCHAPWPCATAKLIYPAEELT